jgi:hypothetical protein
MLQITIPARDGYDEQAVKWIESLEKRLERRRLEHFHHFGAILNALEYQVEEGEGDPTVVRCLGEALLAVALAHTWPAEVIKDITQTIGRLHGHVAAAAQALPR